MVAPAPPQNLSDRSALKDWIKTLALSEGFDAAGIAQPAQDWPAAARLKDFLALGHHATMGWMEARADERAHPQALWPDCRSVLMLALNYGPAEDPLRLLEVPEKATLSCYAQGADYHDLIKGKLKRLGRRIAQATGTELKVFVDTAPVMEKPLAALAGIGWQGKHTNLVSRALGSWTFLGAVFLALDLSADEPEADHCGTCRACLDICPTAAFPAPYQLDARRCISYLTIEHKGPIPRALRPAFGNRIYGCDDCLAVCPWNKFAQTAREAKLFARPELAAPDLADLLQLDEAGFRAVFSGSPIKRIGRDRFLRNVLIAVGNSGQDSFIPALKAHLADTSPLVRGACVWALGRLMDPAAFQGLAERHSPRERNESVREEWQAALNAPDTDDRG